MGTIVLYVNGFFMDFCSHCAPRVLVERKRLKLSQEAAASSCGVSREMWGKYERGKAAMGGDALLMFSAAGADVRYIITGERDGPVPETLTADERELLALFRAASLSVKAAAIGALQGGTGSVTGHSVRGSRNNVAGGDMVVHAARGKDK